MEKPALVGRMRHCFCQGDSPQTLRSGSKARSLLSLLYSGRLMSPLSHRTPESLFAGTALLLAGCSMTPTAQAPVATAIAGVQVVDVRSGRVLPQRTILIAGDRILAIQSATTPLRPRTKVIRSAGKYVLPGLWDMHVHVTDENYLPMFVANGVTGVRDMGGGLDEPGDGCESLHPSILQRWRSEVLAGKRVGPELVISGPAVSGTGWRSSLAARTPAEAKAAVATLQRQGVDFVKVYDRIPLPAYQALAAHAKRIGLPFAGHVPEEVGPLSAIRAGQRSIEHIRDPLMVCFTSERAELERFFMADGWGYEDQRWGRSAHASCPAIISAFANNAVWLTPTLTVEKSKVSVEDPHHVGDVRRLLLPDAVRSGYHRYMQSQLAQPAAERASRRLWWRTQQKAVQRLSNEGVSLLAGTDSACEGGLPGYSLHGELEELVAAGLSPAQALRTATIEPARYLGRNDEGELLAGRRANLVILDANPLIDIRNTRSITGVMLKGKLVAGESLKPRRRRQSVGR